MRRFPVLAVSFRGLGASFDFGFFALEFCFLLFTSFAFFVYLLGEVCFRDLVVMFGFLSFFFSFGFYLPSFSFRFGYFLKLHDLVNMYAAPCMHSNCLFYLSGYIHLCEEKII